MTSENLYSSYVTWCDSQRITYRMSQNSLCRYLTKIFGLGKKLKGDKRGYSFGALNEAISKLEKYEKIDLGLEVDDSPLDLDQFNSSNNDINIEEFNFEMVTKPSERRTGFNFH